MHHRRFVLSIKNRFHFVSICVLVIFSTVIPVFAASFDGTYDYAYNLNGPNARTRTGPSTKPTSGTQVGTSRVTGLTHSSRRYALILQGIARAYMRDLSRPVLMSVPVYSRTSGQSICSL